MNLPSNREIGPISLPSGSTATLRRCDDQAFLDALAQSMPIELSELSCITLTDGELLRLPMIYAALTKRTGPSGNHYDEWKGAFAFPFTLTVRRGDGEFRYLLKLTNVRSLVQPSIYRLQQPGESYPHSSYHAPFDDELSTKDIVRLISFMKGYIEGYLESMPQWTTPFLKEVQSNLILFGYDPESKAFFEQTCIEEKKYEAALKHWQTLIPKKPLSTPVEKLDR